jgi:DNA polymerase-3 subunit gamma/tau
MSIPASEAAAAGGPPAAAPSKQFARRSQTTQADETPAAPPVAEPAAVLAPASAALPPPPVAPPRPVVQAPPPQVAAEPPEPPEPPEPTKPPLPEPPPPVTSGEPDAAAVRSMWTTVREKVRERRRPTDVMLDGAVVRAIDGDTLVLSHVSGPLAKRINEARNVEIIRDALKDALGVDWNVRCEAGGAPSPAPATERAMPAAPTSQAPDDEESMLAEAQREEPAPRRDPEEVALELLQNELGARRIDG